MTAFKKHTIVAMAASVTFVLFNIIAVTNGSADAYYANIDHLFQTINIMHFR